MKNALKAMTKPPKVKTAKAAKTHPAAKNLGKWLHPKKGA